MSDYIDPSRLQLGAIIGRGAFGVVQRGTYRDVDGQTHEVAIKQVVDGSAPAPSSSAPMPRETFMKEVSVTIPISKDSEHVVQCHGWTAMQDGKLALVMTLYDKSLYTYIDEQVGDPLPLSDVVRIGLHIAKGLLELHSRCIVFEDLKPHNVLLDADGNAFLADFGLSKPMKDLSKVYTNTVGGTYFFMPPEKLRPRGTDGVRISFSSDIWAFGITMLQLLCSDTMAPYGRGIDVPNIVVMLLVDREAPRVPAVPDAPELQHTLQACLSLDYKERPSAAQLVQVLQRISRHLGADTQPSVTAAQGSPAALDARAAEALQAQLAAAEARAAAAERRLAEKEARERQQETAREAQRAEQERAAAAARSQQQQQQQQQQKAVHPLQLLSSPSCSATLTGHSAWVNSVAYTPDGATLVSGSDDKTIKLWDLASGRCTATLEGHSDSVRSVAISRDGRLLVSGSWDKTVKVWDLSSRKCTATLTGHADDVNCVAISPDGSTIASASDDATIRLWNTHTGSCKAMLEGHGTHVYCVAFSRDSARLASGGTDDKVRVWDVRSTRSIAVLEGHRDDVESVVFSPDGAAVLSGSYDKTIKVWNTQTQQCQRTLEGHTDWVQSVALTPDGGQHAVSGSDDSTIRIWDWRGSGKCLATLEGHSDYVRSVAVSPDGRTLASGSEDETIKLWRIAQ